MFVSLQVLVVDLDEGYLRSKVGDEGRVIPKKIQKAISMAISDEAGRSSSIHSILTIFSIQLMVDCIITSIHTGVNFCHVKH